MSRAIRPAVRAGVLLTVLALAPTGASATCYDMSIVSPLSPNVGYSLYSPYDYCKIQVSRPYWIGYGTWSQNLTSDYDCYMYSSGSGGADPVCFSGVLASSLYGAGKTDFVVGDFNHNPFGTYYPLGKCFNPCPTGPVGEMGWRDGDLLTVNAAPRTITIGDTDYQEMLLHCFDVYLTSGTKYFFKFQPYGVDQTKLLLFCNHAGGVYWAGRSAAEFEVTGCTTYIAPVTGYYGVVVVNEAHYTGYSNGYTIGVSTDPACDCATPLVSGTPDTEDYTQTVGYYTATQTTNYWMAIGDRGFAGDWDLYAGTQSVADPTNACMAANDATSTASAGADVIVGDFNHVSSGYPYTEDIRAERYAGTYGAATEMDGGPDLVQPNGPDQIGTMDPYEVVRMWDLGGFFTGTTYTFQMQPYFSDMKLDLFMNPTSGLYWTNRAGAALETNSSGTYSPGFSTIGGLAVIKDDANAGSFLFRCGSCETATALTSETPSFCFEAQSWNTFQQSDTVWTAAGVYSPYADFDIQQYGAASGSSWPDCFGSPGAVSDQVGVMDFVVGDFHHNATGPQYARPYQFTANTSSPAYSEWDAGRGTLTVNAAPTGATADGVDLNGDRLWCYQVYLQNGIPYTFEFTHSGSAALQLMLFANPGGSTYWAPRSAAVFSVNANHPYTATATGWYGVVVVNDNDQNGAFTVRVSSTVLAADDHAYIGPTALRGLYPNPTEGALRIRYALAESAPVSFDVLDMAGRMVAHVADPAAGAGPGEIEWDGRGASGQRLAAGVYFVRMTAGARTIATRRVALIK